MIAIKAVMIGADTGALTVSSYVLSARNRMNPIFARAMKKPESRKYVFLARRMKYSAEHEAVSARKSRRLIRILTPGLLHSLFSSTVWLSSFFSS
jgi:hypothetical protein